jgi:Domain of unknown function (DUF4120)
MTAQLIVKCPEHLAVVREFADRTGQRAQFEEKLEDLTKWVSADGYTVNLYTDFAPYSFYWEEIAPNGKRSMNGGLIYHGQHDGGGNGSGPTFSVNLEPSNGWRIHT